MKIFICVIIICFCINAQAQNVETDSLKKLLTVTADDAKRVNTLESLSYAYLSSYPDTALQYALEGLRLAQHIKFLKGEAICINALGNVYFKIGDNAKALEMFLQYLKLKESLNDFNNISVAYFNIAGAYTEDKDYRHALLYIFKAKITDEKNKDSAAILYDLYSLGSIYARLEMNDSALYYMNECYEFVKRFNDRNMTGAVLNTLGEIHLSLNDTLQAAMYYCKSMQYAEDIKDYEVITANYYGLAKMYKQKAMLDSSVYYARKAFTIAMKGPFFKQALETSIFISHIFKTKKIYDSAFHYQELSIAIKDSLFNEEQVKKVQNLKFQEQQRQQAIETEKMKYKSAIKLFLVIAVSVILFVIALLLWRSNKQKYKANILLTEQKEKVESTLINLKTTQAQLIQSEKMASLGELTAGIAHEIQNPLNFVNNFSEVNKELISELVEEIDKGNTEEVKTIANDIKHNEEKINHHGKRADAIVKSMLQHTGKNSGEKEATDINALADEYLKLSYHILRARDNSFYADLKTDFDETIKKINIVPQDIGRALLNLFNNAFYAVKPPNPLKGKQYKPLVTVTTRKTKPGNNNAVKNTPPGDGGIVITVTDNGNGIPQNIIDKIFQPFFTTKPTGQGTGLGLSLSYDIVKAHGGEIKVNTKEGEGSEFIIVLPAT